MTTMLPQFVEMGYPPVEPVADGGGARPRISVMIPTYNCAEYLRRTLAGVLAQDPGDSVMEIEVVDDVSTRDDPEAVVRELGGGRVRFFRQPKNAGASNNFNTCLNRARGELVHILHGDDMVLAGFYRSVLDAFEQNPSIGSYHCRHIDINEADTWLSLSKVLSKASGVWRGAAAEFSVWNWSQFAAVVIRRDLWERMGGFHPSLIHTADWDAWRRAAVLEPVYYDVRPMACYRTFAANETARLMKSGDNLADTLRAIEMGRRYLPEDLRRNEDRSRRVFVEQGLRFARQFLDKADRESAANQLKATAKIWPAVRYDRRYLRAWATYYKQAITGGRRANGKGGA